MYQTYKAFSRKFLNFLLIDPPRNFRLQSDTICMDNLTPFYRLYITQIYIAPKAVKTKNRTIPNK